jgi:2-polyprenyl-3-methyl-5-hydroxy-6-metoxy-1,4-benzoquinol methylase
MLTIVKNKFKHIRNWFKNITRDNYDFDKSNPLGSGGERVDFIYSDDLVVEKLDIYQINHYRRYEFAYQHINNGDVCGDFACGSGYGSAMLADKASKVIGLDIDSKVIEAVKHRYSHINTLDFFCQDLLDFSFVNMFDTLISFETLEHFDKEGINIILKRFANGLKENGKLIFSTPYMQQDDESARNLGFHKTFYIDENKIINWLSNAGLKPVSFFYQDYKTHTIQKNMPDKDFIICIAQK